jgi:caffeoyl-CoA O-methyltransferase
MNFLEADIEEYALKHTAAEPHLLYELYRETHLKTTMPRMLSGHLQGRLLSLLSKLRLPKVILEIGTFTGYSTLCLAEGLAEDGILFSIDTNDETTSIAQRYVKRAGLEAKVKLLLGDARSIIPEMQERFDLVFIDADKENYSAYYDMVIGRMSQGGLIIADNVLWSGKVIAPVKPNDHETQALMAFNEKVCADARVEQLLLPVRDGLMILRVK